MRSVVVEVNLRRVGGNNRRVDNAAVIALFTINTMLHVHMLLCIL